MTEPDTPPTTLEDPVTRVLGRIPPRRAGRRRAALVWTLVAGYLIIAAAFVPWWTMKLHDHSLNFYFNMSSDRQAAMTEQVDAALEENKELPDFAGRHGLVGKLWRTNPNSGENDVEVGGPRPRGDSVSLHIWGYDCTSGRLALALGLGVVVCAVLPLLWPAVRKRRLLVAVVAIVLALSLFVVAVLWFFTTPQRDVRDLFSRGVSYGVYMSIAGSIVVVAAMTCEILGPPAPAEDAST